MVYFVTLATTLEKDEKHHYFIIDGCYSFVLMNFIKHCKNTNIDFFHTLISYLFYSWLDKFFIVWNMVKCFHLIWKKKLGNSNVHSQSLCYGNIYKLHLLIFFIYLFNLSWIVAFLSIYTTSLSVYYLRKYPSYDFHKMCYFINENGTSVVFLILLYYRVFSFYMHINWKFLLYDVTYIVRFICHIKQYLNTKKYKC